MVVQYCQSRCRPNDYLYYPAGYTINDKALIKATNTKIQDVMRRVGKCEFCCWRFIKYFKLNFPVIDSGIYVLF